MFSLTLAAAIAAAHASQPMQPHTQPASPNRLAQATSPYLRQHASNPVDWWEWGPAALEHARREDKPIFLSIGYAACHWCHVMAHESFEDPNVAAVMNRLFVNVKVDREERPDLDEIYMRATQAMNQGQGGWPMSVWLLPDGRPFFAGTYFPPTSRWGRPGFIDICERIGTVWREQRAELAEQSRRLTEFVKESLTPASTEGAALSLAVVDAAADQLAAAFDPNTGGMSGGGSNKFPPAMAMDVMLRSAARADADRRRRLVEPIERTLRCMEAGGVFDQLGGGIHRYSTDEEWHVPHFEKMLYDQALVARIYLDAFQFTGDAAYAGVARTILDYVLNDLTAPAGGFYSTRDADSEGQEGRYYVWTREQVMQTLGPDDGPLICAWFDITEDGNWRDPHEPDARKSIPRRRRDAGEFAQSAGIRVDQLHARTAAARTKLLEVRARRTPPALDDKILVEWNGLMIATMARAAAVLDEPRYRDAAVRAAEFVLNNQHRDGRLLRSYRDGRTLPMAFLSDYANYIDGLLELYESTFERRWLQHAVALTRAAIAQFADPAGGFFNTPADHEALIARAKDACDNAVPSGNSVMLSNLLRLAVIFDDAEFRGHADRLMAAFAADVAATPWASERLLTGVDFAFARPVEVAIVGDPNDAATKALLRAVHRVYLPNRVLMLLDPARSADAVDSPLLRERTQVDGVPTAYVCRDYACQRPVTAPAALSEQLVTSAPGRP